MRNLLQLFKLEVFVCSSFLKSTSLSSVKIAISLRDSFYGNGENCWLTRSFLYTKGGLETGEIILALNSAGSCRLWVFQIKP